MLPGRSTGRDASRSVVMPCYAVIFSKRLGVLLTRVPKWSSLKARGMRLAKRNGLRKATEGDCRVTSNNGSNGSSSTAGKDVPAGTMAVVRSPDFLRALNQRDCACNIDPPASSYAIMRRAGPYRGENSEPGKDDRGELDTETRN